MEVILLERVAKLGQMGEVVRVKDGFARNFLLPQGQGAARHRGQQVQVRRHEGRAAGARISRPRARPTRSAASSTARASRCMRQASETGQLYGSVSPRDHRRACSTEDGFEVDRNQIALNVPIKTIGQHKVPVALHPEVEVTVTVNVARSADEAERLARGEDVTRAPRGDAEEEAAAARPTAEAFFEPGAGAAEQAKERRRRRGQTGQGR